MGNLVGLSVVPNCQCFGGDQQAYEKMVETNFSFNCIVCFVICGQKLVGHQTLRAQISPKNARKRLALFAKKGYSRLYGKLQIELKNIKNEIAFLVVFLISLMFLLLANGLIAQAKVKNYGWNLFKVKYPQLPENVFPRFFVDCQTKFFFKMLD